MADDTQAKDATYSLQPSVDGWSFSQEREFLENLVYQRVNYFLILFGLVVAGAGTAASSEVLLKSLLWLRTVILGLLAVAIAGVQWKLDFVMSILIRHSDHPITIVSAAAGHRRLRGLVGYVIPIVCVGIVSLAAVLSSLGILTVGGR